MNSQTKLVKDLLIEVGYPRKAVSVRYVRPTAKSCGDIKIWVDSSIFTLEEQKKLLKALGEKGVYIKAYFEDREITLIHYYYSRPSDFPSVTKYKNIEIVSIMSDWV